MGIAQPALYRRNQLEAARVTLSNYEELLRDDSLDTYEREWPAHAVENLKLILDSD